MWATVAGFVIQKALPWVWHQIARAWGVFLVGAVIVIIAMRFHAFKLDLYNQGYKKGYSQALTDHPSNSVSSGGVVNYFGDKSGFADVRFWRILRIVLFPDK